MMRSSYVSGSVTSRGGLSLPQRGQVPPVQTAIHHAQIRPATATPSRQVVDFYADDDEVENAELSAALDPRAGGQPEPLEASASDDMHTDASHHVAAGPTVEPASARSSAIRVPTVGAAVARPTTAAAVRLPAPGLSAVASNASSRVVEPSPAVAAAPNAAKATPAPRPVFQPNLGRASSALGAGPIAAPTTRIIAPMLRTGSGAPVSSSLARATSADTAYPFVDEDDAEDDMRTRAQAGAAFPLARRKTLRDFLWETPEDRAAAASRKAANKKAAAAQRASAAASSREPSRTARAPRQPAVEQQAVTMVNGKFVANTVTVTQEAVDYDDDGDDIEVVAGVRSEPYASNRRRKSAERWNAAETVEFYKALRQCGTDFTLMAALFPGRDRRNLHDKFVSERRLHPKLIEAAMSSVAKLTYNPGQLERAAREAAERDAAERAKGDDESSTADSDAMEVAEGEAEAEGQEAAVVAAGAAPGELTASELAATTAADFASAALAAEDDALEPPLRPSRAPRSQRRAATASASAASAPHSDAEPEAAADTGGRGRRKRARAAVQEDNESEVLQPTTRGKRSDAAHVALAPAPQPSTHTGAKPMHIPKPHAQSASHPPPPARTRTRRPRGAAADADPDPVAAPHSSASVSPPADADAARSLLMFAAAAEGEDSAVKPVAPTAAAALPEGRRKRARRAARAADDE